MPQRTPFTPLTTPRRSVTATVTLAKAVCLVYHRTCFSTAQALQLPYTAQHTPPHASQSKFYEQDRKKQTLSNATEVVLQKQRPSSTRVHVYRHEPQRIKKARAGCETNGFTHQQLAFLKQKSSQGRTVCNVAGSVVSADNEVKYSLWGLPFP